MKTYLDLQTNRLSEIFKHAEAGKLPEELSSEARKAVIAAILDSDSRQVFFRTMKQVVGKGTIRTSAISDEDYQAILNQGETAISNTNVTELLLNPVSLTMLAEDIHDSFQQSWIDAIISVGKFHLDSESDKEMSKPATSENKAPSHSDSLNQMALDEDDLEFDDDDFEEPDFEPQ